MSTLPLTLNGEPAELAVATVRDVVAHVTGRAIGEDGAAAAGTTAPPSSPDCPIHRWDYA